MVVLLQSRSKTHQVLLVLVYELPEYKLTQGAILDRLLLTLQTDMLILNELNAQQ